MHHLASLVHPSAPKSTTQAGRGAYAAWNYFTRNTVFSAVSATPRVRDSLVLRPVLIRKSSDKGQSDERRAP